MEYVIVECNESREVLIDNEQNGHTNKTLRVGAGQHTFSLGGEQNYMPGEITLTVADTSVIEPLTIEFKV